MKGYVITEIDHLFEKRIQLKQRIEVVNHEIEHINREIIKLCEKHFWNRTIHFESNNKNVFMNPDGSLGAGIPDQNYIIQAVGIGLNNNEILYTLVPVNRGDTIRLNQQNFHSFEFI